MASKYNTTKPTPAPCPFCGKYPRVREYTSSWIECRNDQCEIQPATRTHDSLIKAVKLWNRRA